MIDEIKRCLISGQLSYGEKLPSVRELALKYAVTPNTVQRSLEALEQQGLIVTYRTRGKFVAVTQEQLVEIRRDFLAQKIVAILDDLDKYGFSKGEICRMLLYKADAEKKEG